MAMQTASPSANLGLKAKEFQLICAALGGLALVGGWLWPFVGRANPFHCPMQAIAGLPCAACGGTRAVVALSQGRFGEAVVMNPLAALGVAGCVAVALLAAIEFGARGRFRIDGIYERAAGPRGRLALRSAILSAFIANWIYLIVVGR